MALKDILEKHSRPSSLLGVEPVKESLVEDLKVHQRLNSRLYMAYFAAVCLVVIAAIGTLLTDLVTNTTARGTILAGAGVTVTGMLHIMRGAVREWSQTNMLITLAAHSDEEQLQNIIRALLKNNFFTAGRASKGSDQKAAHSQG